MMHKLIPLALLPILLFSTQAQARHLQWWEMVDPSTPYGAGHYIDDEDFAFPYEDPSLVYDPGPLDQFDFEPAQPRAKTLSRLERMKRDLRRANIYGPLQKPQQAIIVAPKKPKFIPNVQTASIKPLKPPKPISGGTSCQKGAAIVASFGFEQVSAKSCTGPMLSFSALRGGKPFEIKVVAATGELSAVNKL